MKLLVLAILLICGCTEKEPEKIVEQKTNIPVEVDSVYIKEILELERMIASGELIEVSADENSCNCDCCDSATDYVITF